MSAEKLCRFAESADIETASDDYAHRFSGEVGRFFLDVQTKLTLQLLADWPGATVLDVGGGHAQLAVPLVKRGYKVTVTGSSETCRQRLDRALPEGGFHFRCCDMLSLPFTTGRFDVILAFRLLPHVERWPELIAEMCRVARRAVIVDYPDRRSFNLVQSTFFGWKKAIEKNTRTYRCFTRREVVGEFAKHGFGEPALRGEFFVPMAVHRALGSRKLSVTLEAISRGVGLTGWFGSPIILRVLPG
jgi:2-polyprenyl-3-methyl-5-hydroxy-6-metoxy-1,4-benzoquinol methylase